MIGRRKGIRKKRKGTEEGWGKEVNGREAKGRREGVGD